MFFSVLTGSLQGIAERPLPCNYSAIQFVCALSRRKHGFSNLLAIWSPGRRILGTPFNREAEKEVGFGDKINIGRYTLVCQSYTQDDNPNFSNEWAILNVFKGSEQIATMYPERRLYKASSQPQTIPRIYPTYRQDFFLVSDLYLVYEGRNEETGHPIIKAHLNPLVPWIWTGLIIMIFGTITALVPNAAPLAARVPARVQTAPAVDGNGEFAPNQPAS
jgi:cytochrome c-type biogenesis protein CcmF